MVKLAPSVYPQRCPDGSTGRGCNVWWFVRLLQGIPIWAAGLMLTAIGIAVSQLCVALVRRLAEVERRRRSNELIALVLSVVAVIYAVPLALIAGEAWSDFTEARAAAADEAGAVARTMQVAASLGPEVAAATRTELSAYAHAVIEQEWAEMTVGHRPAAAGRLLAQWHGRLLEAPPSPATTRLLQELDGLGSARTGRILAVDEGLIGAIWWLIGMGGVITLLLCAAAGVEDTVGHRIACGLVSMVIMSVVLLIVATDRPFHGVPRIPPDAMREVLATELGAAAAAPTRAEVPAT